MKGARMTIVRRLERKMLVDRVTGCWNWTGHLTPAGYGSMHMLRADGSGYSVAPHRLMAQLILGEQAVGDLNVCHRCDNRRCISPTHLFLGTDADNMADAVRKGRLVSLRGSARPDAKLTEASVSEIRRRNTAGEAQRALAREFGVSKGRIYQIVARRAWRHVP